MASNSDNVDTMNPKNDDPPSYGVTQTPPPARAHSPMRLFPSSQTPEDIEAQHQPAATGDNREKLHWGNIDSNNWTEFIPCCAGACWVNLLRRLFPCCTKESWTKFSCTAFPFCIGPFPRINRASYFLFPCCTGSQERRSNNIGICLGFLLVGILVFTLVCLVALLVYVIMKGVKKGQV